MRVRVRGCSPALVEKILHEVSMVDAINFTSKSKVSGKYTHFFNIFLSANKLLSQ